MPEASFFFELCRVLDVSPAIYMERLHEATHRRNTLDADVADLADAFQYSGTRESSCNSGTTASRSSYLTGIETFVTIDRTPVLGDIEVYTVGRISLR